MSELKPMVFEHGLHALSPSIPPESLRIVVAGLGIAGFSAATALLARGGCVTAIDGAEGVIQQERGLELARRGAEVRLAAGRELPPGDVLVVSPGIPMDSPWIRAAIARGMDVWGEFELAWRLRPAAGAAPWLYITGTNGKTTTTLMLQAMLAAAGVRSAAVGNIGTSLIDAVVSDPPFDVLAVEVGAPHLPFVSSVAPLASVCLNLAPDHIDYFGGFERYAAWKATVYNRTEHVCVHCLEYPVTGRMLTGATVKSWRRSVAFTLGEPSSGMLGISGNMLVDRAFASGNSGDYVELARVDEVRPTLPHQLGNALAAAALARAYGVSPDAVRRGLRSFVPAAHRIASVGNVDGVRYVDDSKATNCHAAATSLSAFDPVVWIAGGQGKGQTFDELVQGVVNRVRAAVLIGADRALIHAAFRKYLPDIPVFQVEERGEGAMFQAVQVAARCAISGDAVLLAPACAARDMYRDYAERGMAFQRAVAELARTGAGT